MIRHNLEPEIFSFSILHKFAEVASRHGLIDYPVHFKIDSGMHRLGFMPEEIQKLISLLKVQESIKVVSVFSHLAASDEPALDNFTVKQVEVFLKAANSQFFSAKASDGICCRGGAGMMSPRSV